MMQSATEKLIADLGRRVGNQLAALERRLDLLEDRMGHKTKWRIATDRTHTVAAEEDRMRHKTNPTNPPQPFIRPSGPRLDDLERRLDALEQWRQPLIICRCGETLPIVPGDPNRYAVECGVCDLRFIAYVRSDDSALD
jgi:hypothetical protein